MKLEKYKSEFKAGFKDGFTKSKINPMYRYTGYAILLLVIIGCIIIIWPSDAIAINDISHREQMADRYGLNRLYTVSSSYPGAHTVYSVTYDIVLLNGVNRSLIDSAIPYINPFYKFRFIEPSSSRYRLLNGLYYSNDVKTVVISMTDGQCTNCGCGTHGSCCPVQIWIDRKQIPTPEYLGWLIEHELDHLYGLPAHPHPSDDEMKTNYTSENITARYTEQTKDYGKVQINVFKGEISESWIVYI